MTTVPPPKPVPDGFTLHTENTSHILLDAKAAFLNPVQEFNRDLSVASITTFSQLLNEEKEAKWHTSREKKAKAQAAKKRKGLFSTKVLVAPNNLRTVDSEVAMEISPAGDEEPSTSTSTLPVKEVRTIKRISSSSSALVEIFCSQSTPHIKSLFSKRYPLLVFAPFVTPRRFPLSSAPFSPTIIHTMLINKQVCYRK